MKDERELTVAGNYKNLQFSPVRVGSLKKESSTKKKRIRPFSVAVVASELEELDLDSNLVAAGHSFLSSKSTQDGQASGLPARNFNGEFNLESTISYVNAKVEGTMDPPGSSSHHVGYYLNNKHALPCNL